MKFQQRRWFFQTEAGKYRDSGVLLRTCPCAVILAALLLLTSCASLTPERVSVLVAIASQAAQLGAQSWLEKHPDHRDTFNAVMAGIAALARAGNTNQAAYAELLNVLPTSTLAGPEGAVYITADRLVVWDEDTRKSYTATMPIVKGAVAGLKRGLSPMPPMPGKFQRTVIPADAPALTDAQLDAEFERIKAALEARTNLVSTVDVQPQPGGASIVTVRWPAKPGVYRIEQRDEGSVGWMVFAEVTNVSSWTTPWHSALPVGHWRVVRVK